MKLEFLLLALMTIFFMYHQNFAQKTNFELVDSLVMLSAKDIAENENTLKTYAIEFNGSSDYLVLKSKIIANLQKYGFRLSEDSANSQVLNYNLDEVKLSYSEIFKDGIFGGYLVERSAYIRGSYFIKKSNILEDSKAFYYTLSDSVLLTKISNFENIAYSFTKADLPEEPFFSSALEPVIAIGTAAVAVYLFFNIRSK
jgi:hypothetical protein